MWSSTIDPATGRRYYYNKATKETSWTPPPEMRALDEESEQSEDEDTSSENIEKEMSGEVWRDPQFVQEITSLLLSLSSPDVAYNSSVHTALNAECEDCFSILDDHCPAFAFVENPQACSWSYPHQLIEAIMRILLNDDFRAHREVGLKVLISLATDPRYRQNSFSSYQGWTSLISLLPRWEEDKFYALVSYLVAILQSSPDTASIVASSDLDVLTEWLELPRTSSNGFVNSFLVEYKYLAGLHILSKDKEVVGADNFAVRLLLVLASQTPCKKQAMSIAMSICCSHTYSTSLRVVARAQVLKCMNSSLSFQEQILDQWIDSAELLQSTIMPLPPDVPVDEIEDVCFDVFWSSSRDGKGYACLSQILYNAIPPLRGQIESFWENASVSKTSLDLKSDVNSEVLSLICEYIHTNNFVHPTNASLAFEALNLAAELHLNGLHSNLLSCIQDMITEDNVQYVYTISKREELDELTRVCEIMIRKMKTPGASDDEIAANYEVGESTLNSNRLQHDPSYLDHVVSESLQQVSVLCNDSTNIYSTVYQHENNEAEKIYPNFEEYVVEYGRDDISEGNTGSFSRYKTSVHRSDYTNGSKKRGSKKEKHGGIYSLLSKKAFMSDGDVSDAFAAPSSAHKASSGRSHVETSGINDYSVAGHVGRGKRSSNQKSKQEGLIEYSDELSLRPQEDVKESRLDEIARPKGYKKPNKDKEKEKDEDRGMERGSKVSNDTDRRSPTSKQKAPSPQKKPKVVADELKEVASSDHEQVPTLLPSDEPVIAVPSRFSSNIESDEAPTASVKSSLKNLKSGLKKKSSLRTRNSTSSSVSASMDNSSTNEESNAARSELAITTVDKKTISPTKAKTAPVVSSPSKWKFESQQLRNAINAARAAAGGKGDDLDVSVVVDKNAVPYGMVKCPHCDRNFSKEAGERHISRCQDIKAKPKVLKRGEGLKASTPKASQQYSLT